ncbi:MAG: PTS sugar transporter subunit IIA [Opitutales bacterium]|nr:PTS sugar transporter subunit IIA [Opitutales bacterium]
MRLDRYFSRKRVLELDSETLEGCLKELVKVSVESFKDLSRKRNLLAGLLQRENTMTTYLGHGVALPHLRVKMNRRYVFAVGRSKKGIQYEGPKKEEKVHLIILLLARESAKNYLNVLAAVARLVKDKSFIDNLIEAEDTNELCDRLMVGFGGLQSTRGNQRESSINKLIFNQATMIAKGADCDSIAVFGDTVISSPIVSSEGFSDFKTVLVTRRAKEGDFDDSPFDSVIQVRSFSKGRLAQARSAFLVGITRGVFSLNDKICCIGGIPSSDQFDTIVVIDMRKEFQALLADQEDFLPVDVSPEVLERVIGIAMELAVEGREGRPVGTLFVLGDSEKVDDMTKPLVLNPFYGYKNEDRNVLSPFMDETVKEYSGLDGGFVVRGDGVLLSAGSLVHAPDYLHSLPSGFGSRHAAAAAISVAADCLAIVVSASTGQVTLFRNGIALPLMEKPFDG